MAASETVMRIIIEGSDQASAVLSRVENKVKETASDIEAQGNRIGRAISVEKLAAAVNKVSNVLLALGGAGLGIATIASKIGMDFEKSLTKAAVVSGFAVEGLGELRKQVLDLSSKTLLGPREMAQAFEYLASAGVDAGRIMTALEATATLASATFLDVQTSAQLVANAIMQFNLNATQASRVADIFTAAMTKGNVPLERLADAMKSVGPIAVDFNQSLEEVTAVLGAMLREGMSAEQAGTGLRQLFRALSVPSKDLVRNLRILGLSFEEINPAKRTLAEIAEAFNRVGITAEQAAALVGAQATPALLALADNAEYIRTLADELRNAQGEAARFVEIIKETPYGQMKTAFNEFEKLAIEVFPSLVEAARPFIEVLKSIFDWFNKLDEGTKNVIAQFLVWGSIIAVLSGTVGKLVGTIMQVVSAMTVLKAATAGGVAAAAGKAAAAGGAAAGGLLTGAATAGAGAVATWGVWVLDKIAEAQRLTRETKETEKSARVGSEAVKALMEIDRASAQAGEQLREMAKLLQNLGAVRTVQEGILTAIAHASKGPLAELLAERPELRAAALEIIRTEKVPIERTRLEGFMRSYLLPEELNVRISVGEDFDIQWMRAGERLKKRIQGELLEGQGVL